MRYMTILGAAVLASVAVVIAPAFVEPQSAGDRVGQKAENRPGPPSGSAGGVMATQQALKDKGFDPGPIDGVMGLRTVAALKDYQKSENLAMTGRRDRDTMAKLGTKAAGSETRPSR